jgi:hypothetical protein
MNGLLGSGSTIIQEQNSNKESGNGYADLTIFSKTGSEVAILELKKANKMTDDRNKIALSAIQQIKEKMYAEPYMSNTTIKHIYAYGICFCNKLCNVVSDILK